MLGRHRLLAQFQRIHFILNNRANLWTDDGVFPKEYFTKKLVRSSGPGGQNVNKVATKVEIRFNVNEASWIDNDVRNCFIKRERNKINKNGEYSIASDKTRYAESNEDDCYDRLRAILDGCVKQVEFENRVPTDEDTEILEKKAEVAEQKRRALKEQLKKKKRMRSPNDY